MVDSVPKQQQKTVWFSRNGYDQLGDIVGVLYVDEAEIVPRTDPPQVRIKKGRATGEYLVRLTNGQEVFENNTNLQEATPEDVIRINDSVNAAAEEIQASRESMWQGAGPTTYTHV